MATAMSTNVDLLVDKGRDEGLVELHVANAALKKLEEHALQERDNRRILAVV